MPYQLLNATIFEAILKHQFNFLAPLLEISIVLYFIIRFTQKPTINFSGYKNYFFFSAAAILSLWVSLPTHIAPSSTFYFTIIPKLATIPLIIEHFVSQRSDRVNIISSIAVILFATVFIENDINPFGGKFNKNEFGHYALCLLALVSFSLVKQNVRPSKSVFILFFIFLITLCVMIYSRQIIVALFCGFLFVYLRNSPAKLALIISVLFLGYYASNFIVEYLLNDYQSRRFSLLIDFEINTRSDSRRVESIIWGFQKFLDFPLVGHGLGSFRVQSPNNMVAHNTYLSIIYELGLLGVLFLSISVGFLLQKLLQLRKEHWLYYNNYICFFMVSLLAQAFFQDILAKFSLLIILSAPFIIRGYQRRTLADNIE